MKFQQKVDITFGFIWALIFFIEVYFCLTGKTLPPATALWPTALLTLNHFFDGFTQT